MNLLPLTLAPLADVADKTERTRWAVTGVQLETTPTGWTATATDTKFLLTVSGPNVAPEDAYPQWSALADAPNGSARGLIPAATWRKAFTDGAKVARKAKDFPLKSIAVKMSETVATLGATDATKTTTEQTKHLEGRFPPHRDIVETKLKGAVRRVAVDGRKLSVLLNAMTKIAGDGNDGRVEIEFGAESYQPIRIHTRAGELTGTGLLMPLSD